MTLAASRSLLFGLNPPALKPSLFRPLDSQRLHSIIFFLVCLFLYICFLVCLFLYLWFVRLCGSWPYISDTGRDNPEHIVFAIGLAPLLRCSRFCIQGLCFAALQRQHKHQRYNCSCWPFVAAGLYPWFRHNCLFVCLVWFFFSHRLDNLRAAVCRDLGADLQAPEDDWRGRAGCEWQAFPCRCSCHAVSCGLGPCSPRHL